MTEAAKANLPILDVHDLPVASPFKAVDHVHYPDDVFKKAEDELMYYLLRTIEKVT